MKQLIKKLPLLLVFLLASVPVMIIARDAPITTAGSSSLCPGNALTVPVTVTNFTLIKAMSLRLDYDPTQLSFVSIVNLNPALAGLVTNNVVVSPTLSKIMIAWSNINAVSLTNGSKLLDINFTLVSGSPVVLFNNSSGGGGDCEYADEYGMAMNDIPSENFYFNATITNLEVAAAGAITGAGNVCASTGNISYSVPPIPNATGYTWTVPPGGTIVSGGNTASILVDYSLSAASGNVTVAGTNTCGTGASSSLPVTVEQLPQAAGNITGASIVCAGVTGISYTTAVIPNATVYLWNLPPGASIAAGSGTNNITVNFVNTSSSGSITVTGNNICGNGAASPPLPVTVNPLPATAGTITGPSTICPGATGVPYNIQQIANATSYNWTVPPGALVTSGSGTSMITVNFGLSPVSGIITVNGVNACGNGAVSPNFNLNTGTLQAPVISAAGALLTSSSSLGNQWYYEETGAIQGATGQTYTAIKSGWYWANLTLYGCNSDTSNHVYVLFTGGEEANENTNVALYPVPNDGSFTISITNPVKASYAIRIFNQSGSMIMDIPEISGIGSYEKRVDMRHVPPGIYAVLISDGTNRTIKKIIVIK